MRRVGWRGKLEISLAAMLVAVDVEAASNSIVPLISMAHYAILFLALFLVYRPSQAVNGSGTPVLAAQDAPAGSRSF